MALAKLALALALAAAAAPAARAGNGRCPSVPFVAGVDQSPSDPGAYGKCTGALEGQVNPSTSHWCKFGDLGMWPDGPNDKAKQCLKFGRMTIYRGPIYGSSPQHLGACKKWLHGDDRHALVAVSTKYLKFYQGGWSGDKGACDMCMCVMVHGADNKYNTGLQTEGVKKAMGLTFLAKVGDRCGECEDDVSCRDGRGVGLEGRRGRGVSGGRAQGRRAPGWRTRGGSQAAAQTPLPPAHLSPPVPRPTAPLHPRSTSTCCRTAP
jgi:hypothetical protein